MITVKENYDEWLQYVDPSVNALIAYLSRQNEGVPVTELNSFTDENGNKIVVTSNGFSYVKNDHRRWTIAK